MINFRREICCLHLETPFYTEMQGSFITWCNNNYLRLNTGKINELEAKNLDLKRLFAEHYDQA